MKFTRSVAFVLLLLISRAGFGQFNRDLAEKIQQLAGGQLRHGYSAYYASKIPQNRTASVIAAFAEGNYIVIGKLDPWIYIVDQTLTQVLWGADLGQITPAAFLQADVLPNGHILLLNSAHRQSYIDYLVVYDPQTKKSLDFFPGPEPKTHIFNVFDYQLRLTYPIFEKGLFNIAEFSVNNDQVQLLIFDIKSRQRQKVILSQSGAELNRSALDLAPY